MRTKLYHLTQKPKDLDDKIEEENQKLLKSNKALSRATSNLETLKRRVASLEDEKVKFLSTLHDLKAEADGKNHEEELAKVKDECDSLKMSMPSLLEHRMISTIKMTN